MTLPLIQIVALQLKTAQAVTDNAVEVAFADQGYEGEKPAEVAAAQGLELIVVKLPQAKKGFVLLPRRWVVERSFAWMTRFRRLVRDYETLRHHLGRMAPDRLHLSHAQTRRFTRRRFITASKPPHLARISHTHHDGYIITNILIAVRG